MGQLVLWVALAGVAVALPLLALRADQAGARRPSQYEDAWAYGRRTGLTAAQVASVDAAVWSGSAVPDPALRSHAVARAEAALARQRLRIPSRRRPLIWTTAMLVLVGALVWGLLDPPDPAELTLIAIEWIALPVVYVRRLRRIRRALEANALPGDAARPASASSSGTNLPAD